jgi:hypothetical protein
MNPTEGKNRFNQAVYGVLVPGREEGFYLFDDLHDAEGLAEAISDLGGFSELSEELLYDHHDTKVLIRAEAIAGSGRLALF